MKVFVRLLFLTYFLIPYVAVSEGSKNLTPNTTGTTTDLTNPGNTRAGFLAHDANFASAAGVGPTSLSFLKSPGFNYNGATYSPDHRLYVRVLPGETLHFGVHRTSHDQGTGNQGDLNINVRYRNADGLGAEMSAGVVTLRRNTNSARHSELITSQAGVIGSAAQAAAGPAVLNPLGYQSLSIRNTLTVPLDFFFEFNQVGEANMTQDQRFSVYDFWDFTVLDANNVEKPGRLYSKLWAFSAGGANNVFSRNFDMYPLVPSENQSGKYFVKVLELAGLAPQNFFRFVTNSMGTTAGSTFEERRKSQVTNSDYPEYFNFVNNPDPAIWPTASAPTFSVNVNAFCSNSVTGRGGVTFTGTSSESSTFIVLIDLHGNNGIYDPNTADVLLERTGPAGAKVITWDGLNGLNQIVPKGTTIKYYFKNGSGAVNFPMWDAETNLDGFRVGEVRPLPPNVSSQNYASKLFWDDSNLATSRFPAPQTQLFGVASTGIYTNTSGGVHRWGNTSTNALAGDLYTVNTWTYGYTNEVEQTHTYTYDCSVDLAVTHTASGGNYIIGKPFTYTVSIANNGPQFATGITLRDLIDNNTLNFISATPSHGTYNATTGIWTVTDMGVGATRTLTITASPKVIGTINQTASINSLQQTDSNPVNNTATATINVQAAADIEVKNVASGTTFNNGDIVTYTITAKNLGPNNATSVAITDVLPTGVVFESATATTGTYNSTTGVWSVGNLGSSQTATLTLKAKINRLGTITTTASLNSRTGAELDENPANNSSSNTINVNPAADVAITNTVNNAAPYQGEDIVYTIRVTNNGPNNATNVSVADQIPAGLTITNYTTTAGAIDIANGVWNVGTVINGTSQTLTLYARPTVTGQISLVSSQTHTEFDSNSSNNSATSTINVGATADVAVSNVVAPVKENYINGDIVTYTVVVRNNGPSSATNVVVTDKLPSSLIFMNQTVSTGAYNATTGVWTVGTLAVGASQTLAITAAVNQSAVITTTATQTHTEFDNVSENNRASNTIISGTGQVVADVEVGVSVSPGPYYTGRQTTFTVTAKNLGPDLATGLSLNALLPATFEFVSKSFSGGTYDEATGIWNIGSLSSGADTRLVLVVKPKADPATAPKATIAHTLTASVRSLSQYQGTDVGANTGSKTIEVNKMAEVGVTMTVSSSDPEGKYYNGLTEATFILNVTNNGPDKVTNLVGSDTRTGLLDFTYIETGKGFNPYTGIWTVGDLEPGQSKTIEVRGIPNTTGRINLGGWITSQEQYDGVVENNKAVALLNVLPVSDLKVTNIVAPGPYYNGQNTTFTVTLENLGPDAASGVTIDNKLPAGLVFVSATASMGSYNATTGIWNLESDVLPNQPQVLEIIVKPVTSAEITTIASVYTSNEFDSAVANNTASATITTEKVADIRLHAFVPSETRHVGIESSFTIHASNLGPDKATSISIQEKLPVGFSNISVVPSHGTYNPATAIWAIPALESGETADLLIKFTPTGTGTFTNYVYKLSSAEYDPNGQNLEAGNNRTTVGLTITDRKATYTVAAAKNFYDYKNGAVLAYPIDPDGVITLARLESSTLPAGITMRNNGQVVATDAFALRPGVYTFNVETYDEFGNISLISGVALTITGDRDGDGVSDFDDVDDNNDGIPDKIVSGGADPYGDEDGDGKLNYYDLDFIYPGGKAFSDANGDGINDWFDTDHDGIINSLDIDIDGDGITNTIEANGGIIPVGYGYSSSKGILEGSVSTNGMPVLAQATSNSGISAFAMPDTDKDGLADYTDIDADNDGLPDLMEGQATLTYTLLSYTDTDMDGLDDAFDASCGCTNQGTAVLPVNTDGDSLADYLDRDSDEDLTSDFVESFDDNADGASYDDLIERAARFEESTGKGFYLDIVRFAGDLPNWLKDDNKNGIPNFLEPGNSYYKDTNGNGLVDLFDPASGGESVVYQLNSNNKMHYRDAAIISPLPVTLTKFTAQVKSTTVVLNWETATEVNNDKFVVERSIDARTFEAIGSVKGAGNSNTAKSYTLIDKNPPYTMVYYRLKQIDLDGTFTYSAVVSVSLNGGMALKAPAAVLYPNPTKGTSYLQMSQLPADTYTISIYSVDGRMIKQHTLRSDVEHTLDLSYLSSGKYILRITGNRHQQSINFIKQ
ncbi:T9SS type A sorting domain-containing protein [uncultured Pontibacter sp.]|uniref:T9SS type A sorting domain-containing protein n=1 Tax=uncultured Pontibacter sp. TaxID=453356 RepID=UPI0026066CDB|nr:T9SS type A sorting domain-containing protein [uncultured Pontibacter sp.]